MTLVLAARCITESILFVFIIFLIRLNWLIFTLKNLAFLLSEMTMDKKLPTPIGVLYKEEKPTYEDMMVNQINLAKEKESKIDLQKIISGSNTWEVS